MKRKVISWALILAMCLTLLPATALAAEVNSGNCGENFGSNVTWKWENEVLTISGTGAMMDYASLNDRPWSTKVITDVQIETGVTSIGDNSFSYCENLISVSISDTVTRIGKNAFSNTSISSVDIPNTVTEIGEGAFWSSHLTSVTIPGSVEIVGAGAFRESSYLVDVVIFEGVTTIDYAAFIGCENLKTVSIPSTVTFIAVGEYIDEMDGLGAAFSNCQSLEQINVAEDNPAYCSVNGVLFNKDQTELVCYPGGKTATSYTVPDGVRRIAGSAFEVDLFADQHLINVTLPSSLIRIDDYAFYRQKINNITLPAGLQYIGCEAFGDTWITSINIPSSVRYIGDVVFARCNYLKDVWYDGTEEQWNQLTENKYPFDNEATTLHCTGSTSVEPSIPDTLSLSVTSGGLGHKVSVQVTSGHWLTIQTRKSDAVVITSIQAPSNGKVSFSAPTGSTIQVWETEEELTFTNGVPDNVIIATVSRSL